MLWVFSISVFLLGYTYVGYPILIGLLAKFWGRPVEKGAYEGGVSILIAAHNEAETLPQKIEALLDLSKTEPIREICLGLDGCTDGTAERVRERIGRMGEYPISNIQYPTSNGGEEMVVQSRVSSLQSSVSSLKLHILEFEQQRGKAAVLNDLMEKAIQPVFVMMDARQRVEAGAIGRLLENFADEQVGVVSGALVYESVQGGAQKGADSYWGYEKYLRLCESRFWSVPGATGAFYAIRRECCHPIPENTLVDDVLIPMRAVLGGFRCLFEPSARVFDLPTACFDQEGARKRRTLAGIWQCLSIEPKISSIFSNTIWFQWISHKFLRLLTPFFALIFYFSLGFLAWGSLGFLAWGGLLAWKILFLGASVGILASFLAFWGGKKLSSRGLGLLGATFGVNLALIQAARDAWTGRFNARWKL